MILSLDQGTTSSRAIVFDPSGRPLGFGQIQLPQSYPRPGWVEHDPEVIWDTQLDAARRALLEAGLAPCDILGIAIANQRETIVVWERATGHPIHPAIVWQDRRTADRCLELASAAERVRHVSGLELDPYFSAAKVAWILDHVEGARARAKRGELAAGTVDSWLIWRLTGGLHATDRTNASRTSLMNLEAGRWDSGLCELFGVPPNLLPEIRGSTAGFGATRADWFGVALPILAVAGDQQAALAGHGADRPGLAKNTYGTGCFLLAHTGSRRPRSAHRMLETAAAWPSESFALEGAVFVAGAAVQWLRNGLGAIETSAEVEALAASVPDAAGVRFVPAFVGLGAPYWDPEARGTIVGLTRGATKAHLARATLESIAHQTCDVLEAMAADGGAVAELRVDGGAAANDLLMQMQADLAGIPVLRPAMLETTAWGAAALGLAASGRSSGLPPLPVDRVFEPRLSPDLRASSRAAWASAVRQARACLGAAPNAGCHGFPTWP